MKTSVLIVSRHFPAGHPRAGQNTAFVEAVERGMKVHTIRRSMRWQKIAEEVNAGQRVISLRYWTGKPYRSPQKEIKRLTSVSTQEVTMFNLTTGMEAFVEDAPVKIAHLAANDGLSPEDFEAWFQPCFKGSNKFRGCIIFFNENNLYK